MKYPWNGSTLGTSVLLTHELPGFCRYLCTILAGAALWDTLFPRRCFSAPWSLAWSVVTAARFLSRKIPWPWLEQLGLQIQICSPAETRGLLEDHVWCEAPVCPLAGSKIHSLERVPMSIHTLTHQPPSDYWVCSRKVPEHYRAIEMD